MAQKTAKELDLDLQAALDVAKRIEKERDDARRVEAEKVAKAKAAAEKRARKARNTRKAKFENIKIDYEDVATEPTQKKALDSSPKSDSKPASVDNTLPAPKQNGSNQSKQTNPKLRDFLDGFWGRK